VPTFELFFCLGLADFWLELPPSSDLEVETAVVFFTTAVPHLEQNSEPLSKPIPHFEQNMGL
jgi:hypothetical protein